MKTKLPVAYRMSHLIRFQSHNQLNQLHSDLRSGRSKMSFLLSLRRRMLRQQRRKERDEDARVRNAYRTPQDRSCTELVVERLFITHGLIRY